MKKVYYVISSLILIFTIGCAASYHEIKKSSTPLGNFTKVTMMPINVDSFWEEHPILKDNEKWQYQVSRASQHIEKTVTYYFEKRGQDKGTRELKVSAELFMFDPGNRALRAWFGLFGAGKGKVGYHVKLLDGETDNVISDFDAYGSISIGAFGGDIGNAYNKCAGAIIRYILDHQ